MKCNRCGADLQRGCTKCTSCGTLIYRFTDRSRAVMVEANGHAKRLRPLEQVSAAMRGAPTPDAIEPQHILLGILTGPPGVGKHCLVTLGVDLSALRTEIEGRLFAGEVSMEQHRLPLSADGKKLIEYACEHARRLDQDWVGSEHLLLALCQSVTQNVLATFGVDVSKVDPIVLRNIEALKKANLWPPAAGSPQPS